MLASFSCAETRRIDWRLIGLLLVSLLSFVGGDYRSHSPALTEASQPLQTLLTTVEHAGCPAKI